MGVREKVIRHLSGASFLASAPGRVNLLGDHVDYNEGIVLPAAIDRRIWLAFKPCAGQVMTLHALNLDASVSIELTSLVERIDKDGKVLPHWALYPASVAWILQSRGYPLKGFEAAYASDLPIGAGLGSSAAVELAFAVAFQYLSGWQMDRMTMAKLCQQAENMYVGVKCGLMDQFASAHGVARHVLYFDTRSLAWQPISLPLGTVIVVADSGVRRELTGSAYNQRRRACEKSVEILREFLPDIKSLRDVSSDQLEKYEHALPGRIAKRTRHVVEEIARVKEACRRLAADDAVGLGKLMVEGHASLRDLYEVSCVELDTLVEIALNLEGCYGARLTGAGFGGCTINLVEEDKAADFMPSLKKAYEARTGHKANIILCRASCGAFVEAL